MKTTPLICRRFAVALIFAFALSGCEQQTTTAEKSPSAPAPDEPIAAVINGVKISAARLAAYAGQEGVTPENRAAILENVIASELISQAAEKMGLGNNAETRERIEVARQTVLGRAFVSRFLDENPPADSAIDARFEEIRGQYQDKREYLSRHILVENEEDAKKLSDTLREDSAQFTELAAANSKDTGSASQGGSLGWSAADIYVPAFAAALESLKVGEVSAPVQSQFGWHIIMLEDSRAIAVPELDGPMRDRIKIAIERESFARHLEELRSASTTECFDSQSNSAECPGLSLIPAN